MKAKYLGCVKDGWKHTELHYEYRGHEYWITKDNNGYMGKALGNSTKRNSARLTRLLSVGMIL